MPAAAPVSTSAITPLPDWLDRQSPAAIAEWDRLADGCTQTNPFFESWYLLPSLKAFQPGRVGLFAPERSGKLIGLLPLRREVAYSGKPLPHIASWIHPNCFLGTPLIRDGHEEEFWRLLLAELDTRAGMALFLHLEHMPLRGPIFDALKHVCDEEGRAFGVVLEEERAKLDFDGCPEEYLGSVINRRKAKDLRRRRRQLDQMGDVSFEATDGSVDLERWIEEFLALEASGWKGEAGSALACGEETRTIFAHSLRRGAARGRLDLLSLRLDGKPIAMLVNFVSRDAVFGFKTAFDEEFRAYSPGILLEQEYIRYLPGTGIQWADSCAAADHPVMSWLWTGRRRIGRISIGIGGRARQGLFKTILDAELARQQEGQ